MKQWSAVTAIKFGYILGELLPEYNYRTSFGRHQRHLIWVTSWVTCCLILTVAQAMVGSNSH